MSDATQETITGILKSIAEEEKGGKDVIVYQIMRDNMKFPDFITAWPDDEGEIDRPSLKKGERYTFTVLAKPKKDGKGKYLDYVSVASGASKAAGVAPASAQAAKAPSAAPERAAGQSAGYDARDTSIQRQVALKAATELAVAYIEKGQPMPSANIVMVAGYFAEFLATGRYPKAAGATEAPDEDDLFPDDEATA